MENLDYKIERETFLCEAMGICWHENFPVCDKCGEEYDVVDFHNSLPDFSTWEGFGKLFEWATQQDWFSVFLDNFFFIDATNGLTALIHHIHPDRFADAVYEFIGKSNNNE